MGSKIGLAELKLTKDDGTLLTRIEAEHKLREETVYHRRLRAAKVGLPNKVAQHMLPISITHWLLDHWVQTKQITGEILGIRAEFDADDNKEYVQQLAQRLSIFVEYGYAVTPHPGEGIDMTFVPPGFPPMPPQPNGQQAPASFTPPPPPPMPGMPMPGQAPQMAPQQMMMPPMPGQPPQGFPQQGGFPQQMAPQPPMPPMPPQPPQPQGFPQQMAPQQPQGYPQQPQGFPPQAPQQMAPQQMQQPQQGQMTPPTKADPTRQWGQAGKRENGEQRTRRTKEELAEDSAFEAWRNAGGDPNIGMGQALAQQPQQPQQQAPQQPQMQQAPQMAPQQPIMTAPPNPFGNNQVPMGQQPSQAAFGAPGLPQMPQMGAPQVPQQQAPAAHTAPAVSYEDLLGEVNRLQEDMKLLKYGIAHLIRIMHQKPGESDLYLVLTEVAGIRPQ